jgi:5'-nucleotidase
MSLTHPIRVRQRDAGTAIKGTPTDRAARNLRAARGPAPDILLSGINRGPNLAEDITYWHRPAAIEGAMLGIPAIALSQVATYQEEVRWGARARAASHPASARRELAARHVRQRQLSACRSACAGCA